MPRKGSGDVMLMAIVRMLTGTAPLVTAVFEVVDELPTITLPAATRETARKNLLSLGLDLEKPLFGIHQSNGGAIVIFGGGLPVVLGGRAVGAIGASAGSIEQDISVAEAAVSAIVAPQP